MYSLHSFLAFTSSSTPAHGVFSVVDSEHPYMSWADLFLGNWKGLEDIWSILSTYSEWRHLPIYPGSQGIFVHSGCCRKIPETGRLINSTLYFSQFWTLAVWDQGSAGLGSGESLLPNYRLLTSICILTQWKKGQESSLSSFYKGVNPFMRVSPPWPNYISKAPLPNIITLGVWISKYEF